MGDKKGLLALFIILVVLLVIVVLFAVLYRPIKKHLLSKKTVETYGKKIYAIARDNDYLLINNFDYKLADGTKFHIDHLLFGEKFIYVINDIYVDGGVSAIENDNNWIHFTFDKKVEKKVFMNNPLKQTKRLASLFGRAARFSSDFIVSITLINDDCEIRDFVQTSQTNYLSTPKTVNKLVKEIESREITPINQSQLILAVQDIANKLNLNTKK